MYGVVNVSPHTNKFGESRAIGWALLNSSLTNDTHLEPSAGKRLISLYNSFNFCLSEISHGEVCQDVNQNECAVPGTSCRLDRQNTQRCLCASNHFWDTQSQTCKSGRSELFNCESEIHGL